MFISGEGAYWQNAYDRKSERGRAFFDARNKTTGIVVQWNCHPETLSSKNTEISADYVGYTVNYLKKKHNLK